MCRNLKKITSRQWLKLLTSLTEWLKVGEGRPNHLSINSSVRVNRRERGTLVIQNAPDADQSAAFGISAALLASVESRSIDRRSKHGRWQEVSFQIDQPWDPRGVDHQIKGRTRRESGVYCVWSGIESQKITIQDAESEWRRRFELPAHPVSLERTLPNTWARNPGRIIGLTENSLSENDYKRKIIYDHRKMIFPLLLCCYLWE